MADPTGDAIYIRDDQSGVSWTPTPLPIRELDAYRCRHGQGYTIFEHNSHAIEQELTTFVPLDYPGGPVPEGPPVRVQRLRLRNASSRRRRLAVFGYGEWVLGGTREETQMHVVTSWDAEGRLLLARNAYHPDFGSRVGFVACSVSPTSYSGDRAEFLGRNGTPARPAALGRQGLSGRTGAGLDPCYALHATLEIEPGQSAEVTFLLGQAENVAEARDVVRRFRDPQQVEAALQATRDWWERFLGTVQVETPDLAVNFLLNRWLPYQTLSCRIWGRSAFYQSGGAFGFRDQLQDSMAMVYADPAQARVRILDAAAHQFKEGDVQHWWHPQSGAGVRTRFSDDLLWLPFVTAHYVRTTGDRAVLDEVCPFLEGRLLEEDEHEIYFPPDRAADAGTLLEHCRRAIKKGLTAGRHGLPLMGTGDWNDGMSLVGAGGQGESVWLAWFLIEVLHGYAALLDGHGAQSDAAEAARSRESAARLAEAIEAGAWDGAWYRRAYFDDGTPLGSHLNDECKIDSIAQSWGVISGAARPDRAAEALHSADTNLVKEEDGLILLFTPPFERSALNPGYIKGYPAGVRENGGQYTHGAIWLAMAFARRGDGDRAVDLLRLLNPVEHAREPESVIRYKVEPYVVAADVYNLEGHVGRGGWTWYTGSSGWLYRVWLEEVLGLKLGGDRLRFDPVIPATWDNLILRYRHGSTLYEITIRNPEGVNRGVGEVELDGQPVPDGEVPLTDDGATHRVTVRLGAGVPAPAPPSAPPAPTAPLPSALPPAPVARPPAPTNGPSLDGRGAPAPAPDDAPPPGATGGPPTRAPHHWSPLFWSPRRRGLRADRGVSAPRRLRLRRRRRAPPHALPASPAPAGRPAGSSYLATTLGGLEGVLADEIGTRTPEATIEETARGKVYLSYSRSRRLPAAALLLPAHSGQPLPRPAPLSGRAPPGRPPRRARRRCQHRPPGRRSPGPRRPCATSAHPRFLSTPAGPGATPTAASSWPPPQPPGSSTATPAGARETPSGTTSSCASTSPGRTPSSPSASPPRSSASAGPAPSPPRRYAPPSPTPWSGSPTPAPPTPSSTLSPAAAPSSLSGAPTPPGASWGATSTLTPSAPPVPTSPCPLLPPPIPPPGGAAPAPLPLGRPAPPLSGGDHRRRSLQPPFRAPAADLPGGAGALPRRRPRAGAHPLPRRARRAPHRPGRAPAGGPRRRRAAGRGAADPEPEGPPPPGGAGRPRPDRRSVTSRREQDTGGELRDAPHAIQAEAEEGPGVAPLRGLRPGVSQVSPGSGDVHLGVVVPPEGDA